MALKEYRCVVVGDEPAGLWLLAELSHELDRNTADRAGPGLGWLSFSQELPRCAVPVSLAQQRGFPLTDAWSAEIVTPSGAMVWNAENVYRRFPGLPVIKPGENKGMGHLSSRDLSAIRYVLRRDPDLLSLVTSLWKYLGRSARLSAEVLVMGALAATELAWWENPALIPNPQLEKIILTLSGGMIESITEDKNRGLVVRLADGTSFLTASLILNCTLTQLRRLCRRNRQVLDWIDFDSGTQASTSLIPLRVKVENVGIGNPLHPVALLLDSVEIPDFQTEVWPIEIQKGKTESVLTLWVSVERELSLDAALQHLRGGYQRLVKSFPFLPAHLNHIGYPLDMETCSSLEDRARLQDEMEISARELYSLTSFETHSRHPRLSCLMPHLNCQLPYPFGPLEAARKLKGELVGKGRKSVIPAAGPSSEKTLS